MLTPRRLARMAAVKLSMPEMLQWLCRAEATGKDVEEALKKWTQKTPAWAAILKVDACANAGLWALTRAASGVAWLHQA